MKSRKSVKTVVSSLFAALICILNVVLHLPSPGGNGFMNIGDAFVLLSGAFFGPYGVIASAIGSALSDIFLGYTIYIPATAIIKGLSALIVFAFVKDKNITAKKTIVPFILGEIIVPLLYLPYEYFAVSLGKAAVINLPGNIIQAVISVIIAIILYNPVKKTLNRGINYYE